MNFKAQRPNVKYNLEERTASFGEEIILLCRKIKKEDNIAKPLISQLIRSAISIGANYCEADGAESKKDFKHKIGICKKEAKETKHWLRMIATAIPELKDEIRDSWKEAQELTLIFSAIMKK